MRREQQLLSSLDIWCSLFHHEIDKYKLLKPSWSVESIKRCWQHRKGFRLLKLGTIQKGPMSNGKRNETKTSSCLPSSLEVVKKNVCSNFIGDKKCRIFETPHKHYLISVHVFFFLVPLVEPSLLTWNPPGATHQGACCADESIPPTKLCRS